MATEIERKFLPAGEDWRHGVERSLAIVQGWLGGDGCSVRVRLTDGVGSLNIKSRTLGPVRSEYEYPIPAADARELLALCGAQVLAKTRHLVNVDGHCFEIDEFQGDNDGLVVIEIELQAADSGFPHPDWLGREVTDDPRFYNVNLVREPYSRWSTPTC
ncbi:MAG: CYTH domain-containing protein [Xanthomonadales bacterium]|nr:CYTH domain-containing protein [Xanthomonadales bacterium]